MSTLRHFLKKVPNNAIWLSNGAKVPFVPLGEETAVLATDDELTIKELDDCVEQKILGVVPLSVERYGELLKKKPNLRQLSSPSPSTQESQEPLSPHSSITPPKGQEADAAPAADEPSVTEDSVDSPTRGKRGRPKKTTETIS